MHAIGAAQLLTLCGDDRASQLPRRGRDLPVVAPAARTGSRTHNAGPLRTPPSSLSGVCLAHGDGGPSSTGVMPRAARPLLTAASSPPCPPARPRTPAYDSCAAARPLLTAACKTTGNAGFGFRPTAAGRAPASGGGAPPFTRLESTAPCSAARPCPSSARSAAASGTRAPWPTAAAAAAAAAAARRRPAGAWRPIRGGGAGRLGLDAAIAFAHGLQPPGAAPDGTNDLRESERRSAAFRVVRYMYNT